MNTNALDEIFHKYGYELRDSHSEYRVYVLLQGMYYGAEIVPLNGHNDLPEISKQYSELGFACKVNKFANEKEVEDYLFKGFFQTNLANSRIEKRYSEFAKKQVRHYKDNNISYEYIQVPYISNDILSEQTNSNIISDVTTVLERKGAQLIVIEAAAGFGKTCTAFELFYSFRNNGNNIKPLFTELSRNREAKKFKYVLWSEIESEYNSLIKSDLVIYNIRKGKIPLIIDGFDELLSKNIDHGKAEKINDFEQVETMLSTIGELLQDDAKVILTSRKTAIFSGEEFNKWVESYQNSFSVIRFQIEKPEVKHWLPNQRYDILLEKQVPLEHISNPVLLTYLKNIKENDFEDLMKTPDALVDKYFEYLLTREQERQELVIPPNDQLMIFKNLTKSFALFDVTCESRNFVKELIIDNNKDLLNQYRLISPNKPLLDELADTLTNHALLDRIGANDYIGFINEFIHGILFGELILSEKIDFLLNENIIPEELIERAVVAFGFQNIDKKSSLWDTLQGISELVSLSLKIQMDVCLKDTIYGKFRSFPFSSLLFTNTSFISENSKFEDCIFTDSKFERCTFDPSSFHKTSFIGCKFVDCSIEGAGTFDYSREIYCFGCDDFGSGFIKELTVCKQELEQNNTTKEDIQRVILGKYFRVDGKTPRMKLISSIKEEINEADREYAAEIFHQLKKDGYIRTNGNNSHLSQSGIAFYNRSYR